MRQIWRKLAWSITDERQRIQSHFSANSVKHDVYFYKYPTSLYSVSGISFVSTSTRASTKILGCLFPFLFPARIYVKVNIRCSHMHRNSGAQLLPLLMLRKYQRESKDTCNLNPEAETSSEWVGLAGWYCRAGCGRCSHFGDEISLSNPAPYFICPDRPRCSDRRFFTSFNNLINQRSERFPRNTPRDVHYRVTKDERWNSSLFLPKRILSE